MINNAENKSKATYLFKEMEKIMKKNGVYFILMIIMALLLCGCETDNSESDITDVIEDSSAVESNAIAVDHIVNTTVITNVYGDGQKVEAVAVEYDIAIDSSSISPEDFEIEGYVITDVYTNSINEIPEKDENGAYIILKVSTDYTLSNYMAEERGTSSEEDEHSFSDKGERQDFDAEVAPSNQLMVNWRQVGEITMADGSICEPMTESLSTEYENNINLLVDDFTQLTYTDETGKSLMYNLYLPKNYNDDQLYPLVLFMPDATATGSDPVKTLTQGLGAVVWASAESQEKDACIVLAPQFEDTGTGETSDVDITMALLEKIIDEYNVDKKRLYVTGQSAGCINAIQMLIEHPNYFAGAMLVAGQADAAYTDRLSELSGETIWMICSEGDERAYPGMTAIQEAIETQGTSVTLSGWAATLSEEEQNERVSEVEKEETTINFTVLDAGTVIPEGVSDNAVTEHLNTWRVAYSISGIRDWLFKQSK